MTQEERDNILLELVSEVKGLGTAVRNLETKVGNLEITVDHIDQTVMRIEVEHGEKLQILFDADLYKREKFDSQGHTLERHEGILDKHSDEIYLLKSKVQG